MSRDASIRAASPRARYTRGAAARAPLAIHGGRPVRKKPLPLEFPGAHFYGKEELALVCRVVRARSPFRYYGLDLQQMTDQLEREFAAFIGMPHALAVNSGTSALTVALMALKVGPGDEVILPGYFWVSTVSAVVRLGAIPVLADIDESFGMDPRDLERKVTPRTRAVILVHMSGASGNVREVTEVCRRRGLPLLEDVAQAAGATVAGRALGSYGDLSIFSFQLNKTMTSGEGGMVCARTKDLADRAFAAHDLGYARNADGRLELGDLKDAGWGCGSRMSEVTAALALAQLRKLPSICRAMRERKRALKARISEIPGLKFRLLDDPEGDAGSFLLTLFPKAEHAEFYAHALRAEGIVPMPRGLSNIRMTDWGLHIYHRVPALVRKLAVGGGNNPWKDPRNPSAETASYARGTLPRCDDLEERTLLLCVPPVLGKRDLRDIGDAYHKVAAERPLRP